VYWSYWCLLEFSPAGLICNAEPDPVTSRTPGRIGSQLLGRFPAVPAGPAGIEIDLVQDLGGLAALICHDLPAAAFIVLIGVMKEQDLQDQKVDGWV